MYEHALRLGQEVSGLDSLQKQVCFFDIFAVKLINDLGSSLFNLQGNEKLSAHLNSYTYLYAEKHLCPIYFQAKCYLAAMNSLRLVEPKNAWIVKPLDRIGTDVSYIFLLQNSTTHTLNYSSVAFI